MSLPTASDQKRADPRANIELIEPSTPLSSGPLVARIPVIRLENVAVEYRAPREPIRTFKEYAIRLLQGRIKHDEFRALDDVSLEVYQGEVFGIVGHNGAGKSTLLKVVSRVLRPTRGRIVVTGRVAPLLELGAGFHPELSGRENVFLNGTLLGFTRAEIETMFDDIVDFAELGDFIEAPLRTYSTGMGVRLAFAVATASRPDILIVDEVLAVGDEAFQEKCAARIAEFRQGGTTVLLVTHDTPTVRRMCDRALWLDHGRVGAIGAVDTVVKAYHEASSQVQRPRRSRSFPKKEPAISANRSEKPLAKLNHLEQLILETDWLYPIELPSGYQSPCPLAPAFVRIHDTRWQMVHRELESFCEGDWEKLSILDVGCNQGYFAVQLARLGCQPVVGIDARGVHINAADLIRRAWGLENLQFRHLDLLKVGPRDLDPSDVVLMLGALHQYENPIGALRAAKALAKQLVIVETQLAPNLGGEMNWGAQDRFKAMEGSFAVLDRTDELNSPWGGMTPISLCPSLEALIWVMRKLGFTRVEELPLPEDAYEQFVAGKRVMIAGYL